MIEIITGYTGEAHITSADDQAKNRGLFELLGVSEFTALPVGGGFAATMQGVSTLRIGDGVGIARGIVFRTPYGTRDDIAIPACPSGLKRYDVVYLEYARNTAGVESIAWGLTVGTAAERPTKPTPTAEGGEPYQGTDSFRLPAYLVYVDGVNSATVTRLLDVAETFATLRRHVAGVAGCRVLVSEERISVPIPTIAAGAQGGLIEQTVALPRGADYFDASPIDGGRIITNGFNFSNTNRRISFYPINTSSSTISNGSFRVQLRFYKTI